MLETVSIDDLTSVFDTFDSKGNYSDSLSSLNSLNKKILKSIYIVQTDITSLNLDVIVNAANSKLLAGGGVCGSIFKRAGYNQLTEACSKLGGCPQGQAKITSGFKLPSKFILHTVGPRTLNPEALSDCYANCLNLCIENKLNSIGFPCISTGIYGYPNDKAAEVALKTSYSWLSELFANNEGGELKVFFVTFEDKDFKLYWKWMQNIILE